MRQSKQARIDELERTLSIQQKGIAERDIEIKLIRERLRYSMQTERRLDQLIEGMCMGMREGSLPRRSV